MEQKNTLSTGELFKSYDFSSLNDAIENLAANNKELTGEEKKLALNIVDNWESDVIYKIKCNANNINMFIKFFNPNEEYCWNNIPSEKKMELAAISNTMDFYERILDVEQEIDDLDYERPEEYIYDVDDTTGESLIKLREYELELSKHDLKLKRLTRTLTLLKREWKRILNANKKIKEAIAAANTVKNSVESTLFECKQKSQMAKLNISISSENVRNSLKDLLNFTTNV